MSREYSVLRSESDEGVNGFETKTVLVENPMEYEASDYFAPKFTANARVAGIVQIMGNTDDLDSMYESC